MCVCVCVCVCIFFVLCIWCFVFPFFFFVVTVVGCHLLRLVQPTVAAGIVIYLALRGTGHLKTCLVQQTEEVNFTMAPLLLYSPSDLTFERA